jgi:hypothetical protein
MLANDLSLTVQRSTTDADGLELADRPVELLTANSANHINPLTPELNPSAQRCLTRFFTGDFAS